MMKEKVSITFFGGAGSVTGSNFLFEYKGCKALIDCGLVQGMHVAEEENWNAFEYDPADIPFLFITHAHLDHVGKIPKLVRDGFTGTIYSTAPTRELAALILEDSFDMLAREARKENRIPMYSSSDIDAVMQLWQTAEYHVPITLGGGVSAALRNSGHVLGSSMVEFTVASADKPGIGKKIVFTGDLGNSPTPLLPDCETVADANVMVMESVYGDRVHETREDRRMMLEDAIEETAHAGGVLMIPAFSIERTQEILFEIERMMEESRIPLIPVYLDSPLAIRATAVYKKYEDWLNGDVKEYAAHENLFDFPQLHESLTSEESKKINQTFGPKIIIAGSGMSQGGRIVYHEARYLPDPGNTLLFVGYQVAGSLGRELQEGAKNVMINGESVHVRARVLTIGGYSAHKDSEALLHFIEHTADTLKRVYMAMGEPHAAAYLAQRARDYLGVDAIVPRAGMCEEIEI